MINRPRRHEGHEVFNLDNNVNWKAERLGIQRIAQELNAAHSYSGSFGGCVTLIRPTNFYFVSFVSFVSSWCFYLELMPSL